MSWSDSAHTVDYLNSHVYMHDSDSNTDYKKYMRIQKRIEYNRKYKNHEVSYMIENSVLSKE